MLPSFYQTCLEAHLTSAQYLTLQLLIILLQTERNVKLERLATLFPQPIQFESRRRNLQRFLGLPQLSVKLLWFPLVKYLVREQFHPHKMNRKRRRYLKRIKQRGYLLLVIDRTQWKERNLMMVSLVCGRRAIPVYWHLLGKKGNSNLGQQKALLTPVLKLLKPNPVIVIGDREYHSVKLAEWLTHKGVDFALRQKRSTHIQENGQDYQALKNLDFKPGMAQFFEGINCTQKHQLGRFNIALRWRRKYRGKGISEPWYILTSLNSLSLTLFCYQARWGIEGMFKDCKTGGYNLEQTKVNDTRFIALVLLIAIAYSLATFLGQALKYKGVRQYICRLKELKRYSERHSNFWIGLYGKLWVGAMEIWSDLALNLMAQKPQKRWFYCQGMRAASLIQSTV
ncbi:IS4 family transposase [Moorena sp. SIO3I6]|uniref:IS4 family transposase n=1 Tax=Moorena sp. SIO3I6 TaxID=2607831 RepID=UPI0013F8CC7C|nr:IS4 family transposase [Moorena sp. SIO3I6]NEP29103.1 IS4 family transposase [Moorena sp. SIO3I6]